METTSQVQQLKLNVSNIHSFLVKSNKEQRKKIKKSKEIQKRKLSIENKKKKEKKIEVRSFAAKSPLKNPQSSIVPGGSILDNIINFGALVLAGVLVNNLPNIIEKVKETFTAISEFLSPVVTAFQMLIDFVGGGSNPELEGPKTQLLSDLQNVKDGAMAQLKQKLGILGGVVDLLEPLIDNAIAKFGSKLGASGTQLVKKDGKEGFQSGDGKFVETKWTSEQRKRFASGDTRAFIVPKSSSVGGGGQSTPVSLPEDGGFFESMGEKDSGHGAGYGGGGNVDFDAGSGDTSRKIFLHWTAGAHSTPFSAYHTTFLGDGKAVRYTKYGEDKYSHTGGANTGSVGLSIAAMGGEGVGENNFGQYPPTQKQLNAMTFEAAKLALAWGWSESTIDSNVRTHGEWERYATRNGKLPGKPQRWDLDKLRQSDPNVDVSKDLSSGGNELRSMIKMHLRNLKQKNNKSATNGNIQAINSENQKVSSINQPDPRNNNGSTTIAVQRVNTIQTAYVPMPIPTKSRSLSASESQLSAIWST